MSLDLPVDNFVISKIAFDDNKDLARVRLKQNMQFAHVLLGKNETLDPEDKKRGIYLSRKGDQLSALIVFSSRFHEVVNLDEAIKANNLEHVIKLLDWPRFSNVAVNLDEQLVRVILETCQSTLIIPDEDAAKDKKMKYLSSPGINIKEKIYKVSLTERSIDFNKLDVPYYYLCGVHKKIDITQNKTTSFPALADEVIKAGRTFFGHDRLYTLWQAVRNVCDLESPMMEIGVCQGGSLMFLTQCQKAFGKKGKIYGSDTFEGHAYIKPELDGDHVVGGFSELTTYEDVCEYFANEKDVVTLTKGAIEDTYHTFTDEKYSLIHLDADVYLSIKFCLENLADKLEQNGIMIVDDYGNEGGPGVYVAVEEFMEQRKHDFQYMHLLTGQVLIQRKAR